MRILLFKEFPFFAGSLFHLSHMLYFLLLRLYNTASDQYLYLLEFTYMAYICVIQKVQKVCDRSAITVMGRQ